MSKLLFTAKHSDLSFAFEQISKLPGNTGTSIPAVLEASIEGVTLTRATPMAWAKITVPDAVIEEEGIIAIYPETAAKIIANIGRGDDPIEVEHEGDKTTFQGTGTGRLKALAEGSTEIKEPRNEFTALKLSAGELVNAIKRCAPAAKVKLRDNLNGIIFTSDFGGLSILGADGQRVHRVSITKKGLLPNLLLPHENASIIVNTNRNPEEKISLKIGPKLIGVDSSIVSLRLNTAETAPLSFTKEIQERMYLKAATPSEIEVDQKPLLDAIQRITSLADPDLPRVSLQHEGIWLNISTDGKESSAELKVECRGDGITEKIHTNGKNFADAISLFQDKITIEHLPENGFIRIVQDNKTAICYLQRIG